MTLRSHILCVFLVACDGGFPTGEETTALVTAAGVPSTVDPPPVTASATASATVSGATLASPPRTAWFGEKVPESPATVERTMRYRVRGAFDAELGVPTGWRGRELDNGMSESTTGIMTLHVDKTAVVLVVDHGATHESLVEYGAGAWLSISGGGEVSAWAPPAAATVGSDTTSFTVRRGAGKLWGKPAEMIMLRRRFPSRERGPSTLILVGAIANEASAKRREEYATCLASFRDGT